MVSTWSPSCPATPLLGGRAHAYLLLEAFVLRFPPLSPLHLLLSLPGWLSLYCLSPQQCLTLGASSLSTPTPCGLTQSVNTTSLLRSLALTSLAGSSSLNCSLRCLPACFPSVLDGQRTPNRSKAGSQFHPLVSGWFPEADPETRIEV